MKMNLNQSVSAKTLCNDCVSDSYLSNLIKSEGVASTCSYCGRKGRSFAVTRVTALVHEAFGKHLEKTPKDPQGFEAAMHFDEEMDYAFIRSGEPVDEIIAEVVGVSAEIADDLHEVLAQQYSDYESELAGAEADYGNEARYEYAAVNVGRWQSVWEAFERSLKFESRLFSNTAVKRLSSLFRDLKHMHTPSGRPIIVKIGPGRNINELFRARVFQSEAALAQALEKPDEDLGPPPARSAHPGRMNARGVSVFYGATERKTALGEVRPPVGSLVAIGRFNIIRKLRILDFSAFKELSLNASIFDPDYSNSVGRVLFLRELGDRLARAVMPDEQDFDYLPTQAVADFLATGRLMRLDGVMFPSVQAGGTGLNVVLFHKAARVEKLELPESTKVKVTTFRETEEGSYRTFAIELEAGKDQTTVPTTVGRSAGIEWPQVKFSNDDRQPSLRVDLNQIEIREIEMARYKVKKYSVRLKTTANDRKAENEK